MDLWNYQDTGILFTYSIFILFQINDKEQPYITIHENFHNYGPGSKSGTMKTNFYETDTFENFYGIVDESRRNSIPFFLLRFF